MPSGVGAPSRTVKEVIAAREGAHSFLTKLGLEARSSADEVLEVILPRIQRYDVAECLANYTAFLRQYLGDLAVISAAIETCTSGKQAHLKAALASTPFVLAYSAENDSVISLKKPSEVRMPNEELAFWFAGNPEAWFVASDLVDEKDWLRILSFVNSGMVVIADRLVPEYRRANSSGHVIIADFHSYHVRGLQRFDPDASIPGLEYALTAVNIQRARILWNVLLTYSHLIRGKCEESTRQSFDGANVTERLSSIGSLCLKSKWLPNLAGEWTKPSELSLDDLPAEFESDSLPAEAVAGALGMRALAERDALRKLGISSEDIWVISELARNPNLLERLKKELARDRARAPFPSSTVTESGRLNQVVSAEATASPDIAYEERMRSVRTSTGGSPQDHRTYLRNRYTDDGELRCQVCECGMPFDLDDGAPYFEAVQFLLTIRKELYQNRLALCPVCAAKFHHARSTTDDDLYLRCMSASSESPIVDVTLARTECTIRFNPKHLKELQLAVQAVLAQ
jgi:hypothetical protein